MDTIKAVPGLPGMVLFDRKEKIKRTAS